MDLRIFIRRKERNPQCLEVEVNRDLDLDLDLKEFVEVLIFLSR